MEDFNSDNNVVINTGVAPSFLAETLTTDIELTDALLDLIDNSIDAARDEILEREDVKFDSYGLPLDYSGFKIRLKISPNSIAIRDNCSGFDEEILTNSAFITGKKSEHKFGIGHYGLGLKRALLKVGNDFGLVTDNMTARYKARFDSSSFSGSGTKQISAKRTPSKNKQRTFFIVSNLHSDIRHQLMDQSWLDYAVRKLQVRYGIFIQKGLRITLIKSALGDSCTHHIESAIPTLRKGKPLSSFSDRLNTEGLDVYFDVGVHEKYRFPGEEGHDSKKNRLISEDYGLYFISNDRVIVDASIDKKHGFTTAWHNEYSGFICIIRMIGTNPGNLPWNTAKTELKLGSSTFLHIKDKIEKLAKRYRSKSKVLIKIWKEIRNDTEVEKSAQKIAFAERAGLTLRENSGGASSSPEAKGTSPNSSTVASKGAKKSSVTAKDINKRAENNRKSHTQHWITLLPARFPISDESEVLDNLIIESISIEMGSAPHASSMLYRSLLESASRRFIKTKGLHAEIKDYYYSRGAGKRKEHNEDYRKNQGVDLNMFLDWLVVQQEVFPLENRKELKLSAKKSKEHVKTLNGVVHGLHVINDSKLSIIRNDTIALLKFLVEN